MRVEVITGIESLKVELNLEEATDFVDRYLPHRHLSSFASSTPGEKVLSNIIDQLAKAIGL
jgi:hypothetical protein